MRNLLSRHLCGQSFALTKTHPSSIAPFLAAILLLLPEPAFAGTDLPSPPINATAGTELDGVRIGLWTEKGTYTAAEVRNVWMFARKQGASPITIGAGGNLYKESFIFITDAEKKVTRIPAGGAIDGMTNASSFDGGISGRLAKFPPGTYELVWRTDRFESNCIAVTFE